MKDNHFAQRLNFALDQEGFPSKNRGRIQLLADLVGLTHRGASKWVNGEGCPPAKKFPDIAKKLHVNELWLRTGKGFMRETSLQQYSPGSPLNFLMGQPQTVSIFTTSTFLLQNKVPQKIIQAYLPAEGDFFGILLESEAMSPRFGAGTVILFDKKTSIKDGDFVLVNYLDYPEPIFRQAIISQSSTYLLATNPKFDQLVLKKKDKILGRAIQAIHSLD